VSILDKLITHNFHLPEKKDENIVIRTAGEMVDQFYLFQHFFIVEPRFFTPAVLGAKAYCPKCDEH
jgi:hypothetical protein